MSDQTIQHHEEENGPERFMQVAMSTAKLGGACILEWFTCDKCSKQQCCSHQFREILVCGACGQRQPSKVPSLNWPGAVTKEQLTLAIRTIRNAVPECDPKTKEWIEKLEGGVRCTAIAYAAHEVRRTLDLVEAMARQMSGGHE